MASAARVNPSLSQAILFFVIYVLVILVLAYFAQYLYNEYVVPLSTVLRPSTSLTQIVALMAFVTIIFHTF
jgi:hypothetical protein